MLYSFVPHFPALLSSCLADFFVVKCLNSFLIFSEVKEGTCDLARGRECCLPPAKSFHTEMGVYCFLIFGFVPKRSKRISMGTVPIFRLASTVDNVQVKHIVDLIQ